MNNICLRKQPDKCYKPLQGGNIPSYKTMKTTNKEGKIVVTRCRDQKYRPKAFLYPLSQKGSIYQIILKKASQYL